MNLEKRSRPDTSPSRNTRKKSMTEILATSSGKDAQQGGNADAGISSENLTDEAWDRLKMNKDEKADKHVHYDAYTKKMRHSLTNYDRRIKILRRDINEEKYEELCNFKGTLRIEMLKQSEKLQTYVKFRNGKQLVKPSCQKDINDREQDIDNMKQQLEKNLHKLE